MQNENRSFWRNRVYFIERWHPPLRELKFGPPADNPHPLSWGRAFDLLLQHPQAVCERRDTIPTQFHVVIQPAANDVQMRIVQTWDNAAALEIDRLRVRSTFVFLCI